MESHTLHLPEFVSAPEQMLVDLDLVYTIHGQMNDKKDNVILFPTYYTGNDEDNARLIGAGRALDTNRYCIVVPNQFGNGKSSSPSNTPPPFDGPRFPTVTIADNVRAQSMLMDELGVSTLELVVGWSMGGVQTYQWCAQHPQRVRRALVLCGTAKTSTHNWIFLESLKRALTSDTAFADGEYEAPPEKGLRAFASVYVGWAFSQAFWRQELYKELGHRTAFDLMQAWENEHLLYDANDLLSMLNTWQLADISAQKPFNCDLPSALEAIEAKIWLMPCEQDLYFRHEDNRAELNKLKHGRYCGYESAYGHCSAGPDRFASETQLIEDTIRSLLST